jgi:hypothetical protein
LDGERSEDDVEGIAADLAECHHQRRLGTVKIEDEEQVRENHSEQIHPPVSQWK